MAYPPNHKQTYMLILLLIVISVLYCAPISTHHSTNQQPDIPSLPPAQDNQPKTSLPAGFCPGNPINRIHFLTDSCEILPEYIRTLERNAKWFNNNPEYSITIEGHCDERNTEAYNLALGERRAAAARDYLISLGVAPERLKVKSLGESFPLDPAHTPRAWAKNRRVEFLYYLD